MFRILSFLQRSAVPRSPLPQASSRRHRARRPEENPSVPGAEHPRQQAAGRNNIIKRTRILRLAILVFAAFASVSASGCREGGRRDSTHVAETVTPPAATVPAHAPIPVPGWPDSTFIPTPGWGLPHGGAWTPTQLYHGDGWTIEYPASARAEWREARYSEPRELIISELPECTYPCIVTVIVRVDSAADTVASRKAAADTTGTNADNEDDDDESRVIDTLDVGGSRGILYETYCGDCASRLLVVRRGNKVAGIDYNLDDRHPYDPALLERLEAILRSFRWTESP